MKGKGSLKDFLNTKMKHIPNILTSLRIALLPFFIWQIIIGNRFIAGILLVVSGLTDLFDGLLARKFNWITNLGKLLDPIADKFTQGVVVVMLISIYKEFWYFFAFLCLKDFVILLLGLILLSQGMNFSGSKFIGKVSTFYIYVASVILIVFQNLPIIIQYALIIISVLLSLISGLSYIPEYKRYKSEIKSSTT